MSTNEHTHIGDDLSNGNAMTASPPSLLSSADPGWADMAGLGSLAPPPSQNLSLYLHALRRQWLKVAILGFLFAGIAAPVVWMWGLPAEYRASSYLRISSQENRIVARAGSNNVTRTTFELYRDTQLQYVKNPFVLASALRKPEVAKYRLDQREDDPLLWLEEELRVSFPGNAEMMEIRLTTGNSQEAADLVNAVVKSYLDDVVAVERDRRQDRLKELSSAYSETHSQVRDKRNGLRLYAEQQGAGDAEMMSVKQRLRMEALASVRRQLLQARMDKQRAEIELKGQEALLKNIDESEITDFELDRVAQADPLNRQLATDLAYRTMALADTRSLIRPDATSRFAMQQQMSMQSAEAELNALRDRLREGVRSMNRAEIARNIQKIKAQYDLQVELETELAADVETQTKEVEILGGSSVEIEMMRAEIQHLDLTLTTIGRQRDELRVELRSTPRINLVQTAERPKTEVNRPVRYALTLLAMLTGFCVPAVCIAWWDTRAKRINTSADVSKDLGLTVIGSVPLIPARVLRRLGSPSRQNSAWHMRLTESVDGIAARLLRQSTVDHERVVLVTSAVGGEGKTTLATQLAMSLARSGRRTVLVDFDLRRPSFDKVFGMPLEPGISEALRRQCDLDSLVQMSTTDNLSVVTAGRWDRKSLAALANGEAEVILKELRQEYDFVVVDSSPVLPVADARFISQHVDAVILSVFRDVSQGPKVKEACEILEAFGVGTVEAVVTGAGENAHGKQRGYEPQLPAPE